VTGEVASHHSSRQQGQRVCGVSRSHAVALGGKKKVEIKTAQEGLSVVYVIKGQALTRAADQLQQIQSTDHRSGGRNR
jgi:hypothetical protein